MVMSVGMASFERRSEELDAVEVARRAAALIWDNRTRVLPYLVLLAAVSAAVRWLGYRYGLPVEDGGGFHDGETLADFARHGAWRLGRAVVEALAAGMTLRALLGYAHPAWRPDRALLAFTAIYVAAAAAPLVFFLPTVLAWQGGGVFEIPFVAASALAGVGCLVALAWFALRLMIWPIGMAVGDASMTAARAWQAMIGARIAWLFAGVLLTLPLIFGAALAGALALGFYGLHGPLTGPWESPLHAIAVLLWLACAAAVYRLRSDAE
jgi:hypothetical protein